MQRRRFMFWMGLGLFQLAEKLRRRARYLGGGGHAIGRTHEAGKAPRAADALRHRRKQVLALVRARDPGQWPVEALRHVDAHSQAHGAPTRARRVSRRRTGADRSGAGEEDDTETAATVADHDFSHHHADSTRKERHGRPPSKWLRSLHADELRIWLKTIDVPEAGVEGMSYWTHLTRDHYFDPENIRGLTIDEQALLHAAAHFGY